MHGMKSDNEIWRFRNPFRKSMCHECGTVYESTSGECPKCHSQNDDERAFVESFKEMSPQTPARELILFALAFIGLSFISLMVGLALREIAGGVLLSAGLSGTSYTDGLTDFLSSSSYLSYTNFLSYLLALALSLLILGKSGLSAMMKKMASWKTALGLPFGIALMAISVIWSVISSAMGATTNDNQSAVNEIVLLYPTASLIIFGFVGPFVEECAYRIGLFGFLKRANAILAYVLSALVFGFIHMQDYGSLNEWLSFPGYALSGAFLCFIYHKFGFGASFTAHALNNVISIMSIILSEAA